MTTLVAPICGPILGGYISDNYSWPWIFLINVPVGAVCGVICWRNMASRETPTRQRPIDTVGFGLLVVWVGALQVMLDTGKDADWFSSPAVVVLGLVALVGFIAWVIWELTEKNPIVDLSLFRSRNFTLGCVVTCMGYGVFFGNNLLLPLWLQTHMGYIATGPAWWGGAQRGGGGDPDAAGGAGDDQGRRPLGGDGVHGGPSAPPSGCARAIRRTPASAC